MRWPKELTNSTSPSNDAPSDSDWTARLTDPLNLASAAILTTSALLLRGLYKRHLRRIPTVAHIKPHQFRRKSLLGVVARVGDADNFRLYHTPGGRLAGWGWLPWKRVPVKKDELMANTIHVRLAGVDAPEAAHFGRPAQPFSAEALAWLTEYTLHRRVRAQIHRRDQYDRVVATVFTRRRLLRFVPLLSVRRDVGLEMLKEGLATVYEGSKESEFGGVEKRYREVEGRAKAAGKGMWAKKGLLARVMGDGGKGETPREYKTRMQAEESLRGKSGKK